MLKCSKRTLFEVNHKDLDNFICETLKTEDFNFVQYMGFGDTHLFHVSSNLDWFDLKQAEAVRKGKLDSASLSTILRILCFDGHIEAGDYLVIVKEQ